MTPDDVRLTAQLVVDKRVHCVTDESVEALARRVLELEAQVEHWSMVATQAALAIAAERARCEVSALASIAVAAGLTALCVASFRLGSLWEKTKADQERAPHGCG